VHVSNLIQKNEDLIKQKKKKKQDNRIAKGDRIKNKKLFAILSALSRSCYPAIFILLFFRLQKNREIR